MKKYLIYALMLAIPVGMSGGVYVGVQFQKGKELKAIQKQIKKDARNIKRLEKSKRDSEQALRAAINKVRKVQGSCLDPDLPDTSLDGLWRGGR